MVKKYGKSVNALQNVKRGYFKDNAVLVERQNESAGQYKRGPVRKKCKMCRTPMDEGVHYRSHGLEYVICKTCGHVCGIYEETEEFCEFMYSDSDYGTYTYSEDSKSRYDERVEKIYRPKAEFLKSVLEKDHADISSLKILDIGAGSGYFVSACSDIGLSAHGIEMSEKQVAFGRQYMHQSKDAGGY